MTEREAKFIKMTTAPVERLVCGLAVPSMVCMMITSIYNLADTFFVSRINTQSIAAVGIIFSYMGMTQAVSFFFGHGSGNFISRALGARNSDGAESMAATGLISAVIFTTLMACACFIFRGPVLRFFGSTDTIMPYAESYFRYILLGTPFICGCIVLNNQMRLQGNAMMSMTGILSGALLNIVLDPVFIFGFHMGVGGAGLATAVSQMSCFFLMLHMAGKRGGIAIRPKAFSPTAANYREIAAGGLPSLARQGLLFLSTVCLNNLASGYGDATVAAFSVATRVMSIASSLLIGFGQGFQPVCGFNYGAGEYARLRRAIRFTLTAMTVYCIAVSAAGLGFARQVLELFNGGDADVLAVGSRVLRFQCLSFPLCGLVILTNMYLQTTRKTVPAVIVATARQGLFFIPFVFAGSAFFGIRGLTAAQALSDVCSFILCVPIFIHAYRAIGPAGKRG